MLTDYLTNPPANAEKISMGMTILVFGAIIIQIAIVGVIYQYVQAKHPEKN